MKKRYFRKKDPTTFETTKEWVEMTGREFYAFVSAPENKGRHFMDLGDVVLECSAEQLKQHRAEIDRQRYLRKAEQGFLTVPLHLPAVKEGQSLEQGIADETQDVEAEVIRRLSLEALCAALKQLDEQSVLLIHALYLADPPATEREVARRLGISQNAVNKRKKKILEKLYLLVVKREKSSQ